MMLKCTPSSAGVCRLLVVLLLQAGCCIPGFSAGWAPKERLDQPWRMVSLVADGRLSGQNIFTIDFVRTHSTENRFTAWLATSRGLVEYDGFNWRYHTRSNGLPSDFVRCALVTSRGELWVGTDRGAGIYDGQALRGFGSETNLAGPNVRRITEDPDGTLWFCSDSWPRGDGSGGLTSYKDGQWRKYTVADGLPSNYVVQHFRRSDGRHFAVTLEGPAELQNQRWKKIKLPLPDEPIHFGSALFIEPPNGGTILSTGTHIFHQTEGGWRLHPSKLRHSYGLAKTRDGKLMASGLQGSGLNALMEWADDGWSRISCEFILSHGYNEDVKEAPDGSIWIIGQDCLFRWRRNSQWKEYSELSLPDRVDENGRVWFSGSREAGEKPRLVFFNGDSWEQTEESYRELHEGENGSVWGWDTNHVTRWAGDSSSKVFYAPEVGLTLIMGAETDRVGRFWALGRTSSGDLGLTTFQNGSWKQRNLPGMADWKPAGPLAGADNGVWVLMEKKDPARSFRAVKISNDQFEEIPVPAILVSPFYRRMTLDTEGKLWLFGDSGLAYWVLGQSKEWEAPRSLPGIRVLNAVQRKGEMWFICEDAAGGNDRLARYSKGEWKFFPVENLNELTLCYDNTILAAGVGRFTVIPEGPEPDLYSVPTPEPIPIRKLLKDRKGTIWLGGMGRVYRFIPDKKAPETFLTGDLTRVQSGQPFKATAVAVNAFLPRGFGQSHRVSWRLDGGEWTPMTPVNVRFVDTTTLSVGHHRLEARAEDSALDTDATPAMIRFEVLPVPMQSRGWFIPVTAGLIVTFAGLAISTGRARWKLAGYARELEQTVEERTSALRQDIQARQQVEKELRKTEERFAKAFRANPAIIAISSYPDGKLVDVNQAFTSLLGFTYGESVGRRSVDLNIWANPEQRTELVGKVIAGETVSDVECVLRTKSGDHLTVLATIEEIELSGSRALLFINYDITQRKQAESTLKQSEERFRQLAENIREVFWITNPEKTKLIYLSPAFEKIWGIPCASVYESPRLWLSAIHPEDRERVLQAAINKQALGTYDESYRVVRPDGSVRLIHDRATPIRDDSGNIYRVVGIAEDVTERSRLEAQVRESQKLEALGTLAGGIAHDFNNILSAMLGNLNLAMMDVPKNHQASESLDEIRQAGERARGLVKQILAFSRQQTPEKKAMGVGPLVSEVVSLLRAILPAGVELRHLVATDAPEVLADSNQIHQVLMNLCTNSWHALENNVGRITVEVKRLELTASHLQELAELKPGPHAVLSVIDNGHGMDPDTLGRIFEPFFTTKGPGGGTGLGLSVVHGIVRSHGGAIRVESRKGMGTSFHIYLPAIQAATTTQTATEARISQGKGQRILYLDDEKALVSLASRTLKRIGYEVTGFNHPEDALEAFRKEPAQFDLIITDFNMPGSNGLQFVESIRGLGSQIPVILNSGYLTEDLMERARSLNIRKILSKPASIQELSQAAEEAIRNA